MNWSIRVIISLYVFCAISHSNFEILYGNISDSFIVTAEISNVKHALKNSKLMVTWRATKTLMWKKRNLNVTYVINPSNRSAISGTTRKLTKVTGISVAQNVRKLFGQMVNFVNTLCITVWWEISSAYCVKVPSKGTLI